MEKHRVSQKIDRCFLVIGGDMKEKRIFIVKNKDIKSEKYNNAKNNYESKGQRYGYYNTDGENEDSLENCAQIGEKGIILLISYSQVNANEIQNIFIGTAQINDKWNIKYKMYRYLEKSSDARAIESIIDKVDLDLNKDFASKTYVIISDMQSLYEELKQRIFSSKYYSNLNNDISKNIGNNLNEETKYVLSPLAQKDVHAIRIHNESAEQMMRTEFQKDRERIVNSKAFRRLVDKAQIFSADKGDYYRTRMTHTLEVNQIAKAIAFALKLNMDLTEAIALGHDLGHTPFGHQGERTLDDILSGKIDVGIEINQSLLKQRCFGGFKHNYQSAKILAKLEEQYTEFSGLNISVQVLEGVLKHTKFKSDIKIEDFLGDEYLKYINIDYNHESMYSPIATLEGQVVAIADEIAQRGHDVDDALTSGVMTIDEFLDRLSIGKCTKLKNKIEESIKKIENSGRLLPDKQEILITRIVQEIVRYFINDTIVNSKENIENNSSIQQITMDNIIQMISLHEDVKQVNSYLERIVQKKVICNHEVARADYNAEVVIKTLFCKYYHNPRLLHRGTLQKIFIDTLNHDNLSVSNSAVNLNDCDVQIAGKEIEEMSLKSFTNENELGNYIQNGKISESNARDAMIFEKRKILIHNIVDFIAGMTDGYALEEYEKLR